MSWRWTRDGQNLTSTCQLCHATITGRRDGDVTLAQRSHGWWECQQMRAIAARALATEVYVATLARKPPPKLRELRTHCRDNHEYTPENTRMDGRGRRVCKTCEVLRVKAWRERQKTARRSRVSPTIATVLGVSADRIGTSGAAPDLTPKPLLNTPSRRSILMQNNSASATPRQNSEGVA